MNHDHDRDLSQKAFSLLLSTSCFFLICLNAYAVTAVLDDFSQGNRTNWQGYPMWQTGDASMSVSVNSPNLTLSGAHISRQLFDIVSIVPGIAPLPWTSNCTSQTPCALMTLTEDAPWSPNPGASLNYFTFHNLKVSGSCSSWTYYQDVEGYNPVFQVILQVDARHYWVYFGFGLDLTNCNFQSGQIYNNCAKGCGAFLEYMTNGYIYPEGFVAGNVMAGETFNPVAMNRLTWKFMSTKTVAAGKNDIQIGMYTKDHADQDPVNQGNHPYNGSNIDIYAGRWYTVTQNRLMDHDSGGTNGHPEDYTLYNGAGDHVWDALTRWYFSTGESSLATPADLDLWSGVTLQYQDFYFYQQTGEPEGYMGSLFYGYTGNQPGVTTGRYDVGWNGPLSTYGSYEFRYSPNVSMKVSGFSNGTSAGLVPLSGQSQVEYTWSSPDLPEAPAMYIAARPTMEVAMVATDPNGHIMVMTGDSARAGFGTDSFIQSGDTVHITGVQGCTAANGDWTVTNLPRFSFPAQDQSVRPIAPGTLAQVQVIDNNGTTIVTTTIPHGLTVGRLVDWIGGANIMAATPVTQVIDATHFQIIWKDDYYQYQAPGTYPGGLAGSGYLYVYSALELNGSGSCNAPFVGPGLNGGVPTLVATDDTRNFTEICVGQACPNAPALPTQPLLAVSPSRLNFSSSSGTPPGQTLMINNYGKAALQWTASTNASWLSISAAQGGDNQRITVSVNPAGLLSGTTSATLLIIDPNALSSPQVISVVFQNGAAGGNTGSLSMPQVTFPSSMPINGALTIGNISSYPSGTTFQWTMTPIGNAAGTSSLYARDNAGSASQTIAATLQPMTMGLSLQTYKISVVAMDGSNQSPAATGQVTFTTADLSHTRVYPNPWRSDKHAGKNIIFDGLTTGTTIKLFTISGHKVAELHTDEPSISWDLKNESGDKVASGIYLYLITDNQGDKVRGKVGVIK